MNKIVKNYLFPVLLSVMIFQLFIKNHAEADGKSSYEQLLAGKAIFVDVREEAEVKEGMVKGALWFPLSQIENDKKNQLEKIKAIGAGKQIYVYCRSGNRSGKVKSYLEEAGVKAMNLGGFSSLVDQKLPTQSGPQ
jgi:rhodanese-related sulfurtransferase